MNVGIIHQIPLAVHHVVADLDVSKFWPSPDTRCRGPRGFGSRAQQQDTTGDHDLTLYRDAFLDLGRVPVAEVGKIRRGSRLVLYPAFPLLLSQVGERALWMLESRVLCPPDHIRVRHRLRRRLQIRSPLGGFTDLPGAHIAQLARSERANAGETDPDSAAERELQTGILAGFQN